MRRLGVVFAIALLAGCSGSTSVHPFGGAYDLVSVDGQRDPQPFYRGTTTPDLVGGTLSVGPDSLDVMLSLQDVDSTGRPTGEIENRGGAIPYTRRGDSLFTAFDTTGQDGLLPRQPAAPVGAILGSNVALTLYLPETSSIGFASQTRHFLFSPAP